MILHGVEARSQLLQLFRNGFIWRVAKDLHFLHFSALRIGYETKWTLFVLRCNECMHFTPVFSSIKLKLYANMRQITDTHVPGHRNMDTCNCIHKSEKHNPTLAFSRRISSCLSQELFSSIERPKLSIPLTYS